MNEYLDRWVAWITEKKQSYQIHVTNQIIKGLVDKIACMGQSFLEWGYGTGYTAIALANLKKQVTAYDPAFGLLEAATEARAKYLISLGGSVNFTSTLADLRPADIVYSQGLLEHFDDSTICQIVREQLVYAKIAVVFSVPSDNYKTIDFGDERLMGIAEWERILEPFKVQLAQLYYYERRQHLMGVIRCQNSMKN